jgi:two-component system phosphate regulon sensor histidine kinase PhoR
MYSAALVADNGKVIGVVRLAKSLADYDLTIRWFNRFLYIIGSATFLIGLILNILQTSKKFNPLKKLSQQIYEISAHELRHIPVKQHSAEIGQIQSAFNSMVDRVNLQIQNLQSEKTKMTAILASMNDGVIEVNRSGFVTLVNEKARQIFGISIEESIEKSLIEVVRQHQIVELFNQVAASGVTQNALIKTSLDQDTIQVIGSILEDDNSGKILLLFHDLTLIKKLEIVRRDFISNISHELRTPLASLKALSETLQDGALNDPNVSHRFLRLMDDEIDNLNQLVQELLELSKIESGKVPLEKRSVTVKQIIDRPVERMRLQAERAGLSILTNVESHLPKLDVDLVRIQQVLTNIIHNAIKFTPPGGNISINAQQVNQNIVFSVKDSGNGIAQEDLTRIFERFFKTDRSRSGSGTGLGLSIAKHIIETHNGRIWAESTIGEGSVFYFSLPTR